MARQVVVTGAGGVLGRRLVRALGRNRHCVRALGRGAAPKDLAAPWATVDLADTDALRSALRRGDVVVHAASDPSTPGADLCAAGSLAMAARKAGVAHIVYVQIAGLGGAAQRAFGYYREKRLAEETLLSGAAPCSTFCATQFHGLVDRVFTALAFGPLLLRPAFTLQPVDPTFVAERLADHVETLDPRGVCVCGPEVLTSREMADTWLAGRGRRRVAVPAPAVGPLAGFAKIQRVAGLAGGRTWAQWLARGSTANVEIV